MNHPILPIKATVDSAPLLSLQLNKGMRHRIMKSGIKQGSLWIEPRSSNYFRVLISGGVDELLSRFMEDNFGEVAGMDQGKKYWKVEGIESVLRIIHSLAKP